MSLSIKIVCSIGPDSASVPVLKDMITAGMNVARLGSLHTNSELDVPFIDLVRAASEETKIPVAIMQDLKSPQLHVGSLPNGYLTLSEGDFVRIHTGVVVSDAGVIPVPYDRLAQDVRKGDRVLFASGTLEAEVFDVQGIMVIVKIVKGGRLVSHNNITVPTTTLSLEHMTDEDDRHLMVALKQNVDCISSSFIRSAQDVQDLRRKIEKMLPRDMEAPCIIAIIEKQEAVENFTDIIAEADGALISKHIPAKDLIAVCRNAGKVAILEAYAMDARHAEYIVSDCPDAVAFIGKPTVGKYPAQMVREAVEALEHAEGVLRESSGASDHLPYEQVPSAVAKAAVVLARSIRAGAILVTTGSGYSARQVARLRPRMFVYAATASLRVYRQLLLSWGISPLIVDGYDAPETMEHDALEVLRKDTHIVAGSKIVVISGLKKDVGTGYDSTIRVRQA